MLQPHRMETFKLSSDRTFVTKMRDVEGLYVSPPERAIVLRVDEKSQIQALDRGQPMLPILPVGDLLGDVGVDAIVGLVKRCFA